MQSGAGAVRRGSLDRKLQLAASLLGGHALERHHGAGTSLFRDLRLLNVDDIHDDAAFELLAEADLANEFFGCEAGYLWGGVVLSHGSRRAVFSYQLWSQEGLRGRVHIEQLAGAFAEDAHSAVDLIDGGSGQGQAHPSRRGAVQVKGAPGHDSYPARHGKLGKLFTLACAWEL